MNIPIQTAASKGKPLTVSEIEYALIVLRAINYRIRHSDAQETNGKLNASYYVGQSIMNVSEYLANQLPFEKAMEQSRDLPSLEEREAEARLAMSASKM